jgi:hypothetical protein
MQKENQSDLNGSDSLMGYDHITSSGKDNSDTINGVFSGKFLTYVYISFYVE